jgi:hypothetical protein
MGQALFLRYLLVGRGIPLVTWYFVPASGSELLQDFLFRRNSVFRTVIQVVNDERSKVLVLAKTSGAL